MANKVSMTLPPESAQWGRSVESRLSSIERINSNLVTSVNTANATLGALLKASRELAQQQEQITAQVEFLNNQIVYMEAWNQRNWTSPSEGAYYEFPFDPANDIFGSLTTSSTGKILVSLSSSCQIITEPAKTGWVQVVINFTQGSETSSLLAWAAQAPSGGEWSFNMSGPTLALELNPSTTYQVRSEVNVGGGTNTWIALDPLNLSITKVGM